MSNLHRKLLAREVKRVYFNESILHEYPNFRKELMKILIKWHYENIREDGVFELENFIYQFLQKEKDKQEKIKKIISRKFPNDANNDFRGGYNLCLYQVNKLLQ